MNNVKKVCRLALLCVSVSTLVACSSISEKQVALLVRIKQKLHLVVLKRKGCLLKQKKNSVQAILIHKMLAIRQLSL